MVVAYDVPVGKLDFLLASKSGGCWVLANGQVRKYKADQQTRDLGPYPWSTGAPVLAACEDQAGNLVVGTYGGGVWRFDAAGKPTQPVPHSFILSLVVDREGSLWIGTDGGGLNRVKPAVCGVLDESLKLTIQSVCADAQGGLWFAINGGGVNYWKDGAFQHFGTDEGLTDLYVRSVFVDRSQRVLVGTSRMGLLQLMNGRFQQSACLIRDRESSKSQSSIRIVTDKYGLGRQGGWCAWASASGKPSRRSTDCHQIPCERLPTTREGISGSALSEAG